MALIFPRLARNFIKNGYFPTDEVTLERILGALDIDGEQLRILDPCCGEGTALAEAKRHLEACGAGVTALGVEFDQERAWHAKRLLDTVMHTDVQDAFVAARSIGLLFLNPPYGHSVADNARTGDGKRTDRLEMQFLRRTLSWIQPGGILALIVPHYVFDEEMANLIARNFTRVSHWMAPETRFKQCVVLGVKRRSSSANARLGEQLVAMGAGTLPPVLPEQWSMEPYQVPGATDETSFAFNAIRLNGPELASELDRMAASTLWPQFGLHFQTAEAPSRRPLRDLSDWHLALALAAGQIGGFVTSRLGRTLLIKGATYKDKKVTTEVEDRGNGNIVETRTATDRFVPVIRAIDFTEGSPDFGRVITIS